MLMNITHFEGPRCVILLQCSYCPLHWSISSCALRRSARRDECTLLLWAARQPPTQEARAREERHYNESTIFNWVFTCWLELTRSFKRCTHSPSSPHWCGNFSDCLVTRVVYTLLCRRESNMRPRRRVMVTTDSLLAPAVCEQAALSTGLASKRSGRAADALKNRHQRMTFTERSVNIFLQLTYCHHCFRFQVWRQWQCRSWFFRMSCHLVLSLGTGFRWNLSPPYSESKCEPC